MRQSPSAIGSAPPALDQVTGWSKARPKPVDAGASGKPALFGGWRLKDREGR